MDLKAVARRAASAIRLVADIIEAFSEPPEPELGEEEFAAAAADLDGPLTDEGAAMLAHRIPQAARVPVEAVDLVGSLAHRRKQASR